MIYLKSKLESTVTGKAPEDFQLNEFSNFRMFQKILRCRKDPSLIVTKAF